MDATQLLQSFDLYLLLGAAAHSRSSATPWAKPQYMAMGQNMPQLTCLAIAG